MAFDIARRRLLTGSLAATAVGAVLALGSWRVLADSPRSPIEAPGRVTAHYVSPRGDDSNPGTRARPWRTLTHALAAARPGWTIVVRGGTYAEWATIARSGRPALPIVLRAGPGERPVVTGRLKISGSYVRVSGFRFRGGTPANPASVLIYVAGGDHVEIRGNEIEGARLSGVYVGDSGDSSNDVAIVGNYVHDNGSHENLDHGLYLGHVRRGIVVNNVLEGNYAHGVKLGPEVSHLVAAYNTVVANGRSGVMVGGNDDQVSSENVIVSNVIEGNADWGIRTFWLGPLGAGNIARENVLWENGKEAVWFPRGGIVARENLLADPRLDPLGGGVYELLAGSPAVGRGLPEYAPRTDYKGRVRDLAPDAGAFER